MSDSKEKLQGLLVALQRLLCQPSRFATSIMQGKPPGLVLLLI